MTIMIAQIKLVAKPMNRVSTNCFHLLGSDDWVKFYSKIAKSYSYMQLKFDFEYINNRDQLNIANIPINFDP